MIVCLVIIDLTPAGLSSDLTPVGLSSDLTSAGLSSDLTPAGLSSDLLLPGYHLRPGHTAGYIPDISPQFNLDLSMLN